MVLFLNFRELLEFVRSNDDLAQEIAERYLANRLGFST